MNRARFFNRKLYSRRSLCFRLFLQKLLAKVLTKGITFWYSNSCPLWVKFGGIAQLARACGSYPQCPRFKSRCRYQIHEAFYASWIPNGPLVKWLRHGPFTAVTWVRIPYGSPSHRTPCKAVSCGSPTSYGGLAQLVRAPASHAGGHWFESSSLHQKVPDFARNQELFFCLRL